MSLLDTFNSALSSAMPVLATVVVAVLVAVVVGIAFYTVRGIVLYLSEHTARGRRQRRP